MTHVPPGPFSRRGPRPLLLHLSLALMREQALLREKAFPGEPTAMSSSAFSTGSTGSTGASPIWSATDLAEFMRGLGAAAANPLTGAMPGLGGFGAENGPFRSLLAGIAAYRRHPWRRALADPPIPWSEGGTRLLDYSPRPAPPGAPALLLIPSLINRGYVLDLAEGRSMARWLASAGIRPMLLDWGWPDETERRFGLADYIDGRLARAIAAAAELADGPIVLGGYCMGGLLAVAAALRQPARIKALALLATPWDFHAGASEQAKTLGGLSPMLEPSMAATGTLCIDALQMLFALLEPEGIAAKYRAFAKLDQSGEPARMFVALEDWLNDGVPLAAPVARECLAGWYGANLPGRLEWRLDGQLVDPRRLAMPSFAAIPARDRIVPPESARPLAALIPGCVAIEPGAGHIGMAAGSRARTELWVPLRDWIFGL